MEILMFFAGLGVGFILTAIVYTIIQNKKNEAYQQVCEKMQLQFENLSNRIFKETTQDFSSLTKERLSEILEPFKEKFEDFNKQSALSNEQFVKLDLHIKDIIETGAKISSDTNTLSSALKGDNIKQGKWGELILERVLELSGLRKGEEYILQASFERKKPDAVILLPENRAIYIDAKTTLSSYEAYANAQSQEEASHYFNEFSASVKKHIAGLSGREYFEIEEYDSPEYVLMFIPIESCYSLLFSNGGELWELAWKNKIMPVSPSTLLAALKIISSFNVVNRQNKNAQEIARLSGRMIDKFVEVLNDVKCMRSSLDSIYKKLDGQGNLIRQAQKLEELGAKAAKQIPEEYTK